jgi:hypothetical protein
VTVKREKSEPMKIDVTVAVSGNAQRQLRERARILSSGSARRLERELEEELQSVEELQSAARSERAADPETRRDALERAVRRIWGATL